MLRALLDSLELLEQGEWMDQEVLIEILHVPSDADLMLVQELLVRPEVQALPVPWARAEGLMGLRERRERRERSDIHTLQA